MPNNVRNRLTIKDIEDAEEAFSFMGADYGMFDFERLCPIPPYVWRGGLNDEIAKIFGARSNRFGDSYLVDVYESGDTWLAWCLNHWGTKWNAYSFKKIEDTTVQFDTAWNPVPRIVLLLAQKFGITDFVYEWADEVFACNTGRITGKKGVFGLNIEIYQPENLTKEAFDLAAMIRPDYVKTDENQYGFYWDEDKQSVGYCEADE